MSSNPIRIGAQIFEMARERGDLMSHSAAQQIEYWARLGAALEATGLSVADVATMLRGDRAESAVQVQSIPEEQMWAEKRARQAWDPLAVHSGSFSGSQMR